MRTRGPILTSAIALILSFAGTPAPAQPLDDLERDDSLALSIAWRMQVANAPYCARAVAATGVQLEDTAAYEDPAAVRSAYGLSGDIYIGAIARDGPGDAAGLSVNTTIAAINGQPVATIPAPSPRAPFERLKRVQAMLDDAAARDGIATLTTADGRTVRIKAVQACHVAVTVDDGKNYAKATRDEVRLGRKHFDAAQGNVDILAAMIGHEMAHAVLDHHALLVASHGSMAVIRRTEREADRLSVWLMANAGYRPEGALEFQRTIIAAMGGFLRIDPSHGNWRERARVIAAEIAVLKAAPDADWPHRFQREP